jgi:hypothetical protein
MGIITLPMYQIWHEKRFLIKQKEAIKQEMKTYTRLKEFSDVYHRFMDYLKYLKDQIENNSVSMTNEILLLPIFSDLIKGEEGPLHKKQKTSQSQLIYRLAYRQSKVSVDWEDLSSDEIYHIRQLTHIDEWYGGY